MFKHSVQFVPKGTSPGETKSVKTIQFKLDSNDKKKVKSKAKEKAVASNKIDEYALRNHWVIFNCDIEYTNTPWDGFDELCGDLLSYDEAKNWKLVENKLYVVMKKDNVKQDYIKKVESYYKPLKPMVYKDDIVIVHVEPRYS